jgi:hypothetical protein
MLFKAIADGNAQLVSEILKCRPQEYFKNKEGQTPLHAAALLKRPNDDIVTVLIKTMPRDTTRRDKDDRVPLHLAVRTAWESGSEPEDEERKSEFSNVIKELMRNMERDNLDILDGEGRSPWDQNLCRKTCKCIGDCASIWILELKENLDPISGPAIEQKHHQLTQRMIPKQGSPEYRACFGFDGTLSEFYYVSEKSEEQINLKTPSVYKMIYDTKTSCARILQISRPDVASPDFRCRWIHVPANNEQWLSVSMASIAGVTTWLRVCNSGLVFIYRSSR